MDLPIGKVYLWFRLESRVGVSLCLSDIADAATVRLK